MPYQQLALHPGVNTQLPPTSNQSGWSASNLIRWRTGLVEKLAGWQRLFNSTVAGTVRSLHAYEDLSGGLDLLIAGDGGAQVYVNSALHTLNFVGQQRVVSAAYMSAAGGTSTITVHDVAHGQVAGAMAHIRIPVSIGGITIYPEAVTIASVTDADNWTFNAGTVVSAGTSSTPQFLLDLASFPDSNIAVNFANHGLSAGQSFVVNYDVVWTLSSPGTVPAVLKAGSYIVLHVDGGVFWLNSGQPEAGSNVGHEFASAGTSPLYYGIAAPSPPPADWFTDNFGNDGIISYTNSGIYAYSPPVPASGDAILTTIAGAPTINAGTFVAMPQAQIIAFGSEITLGQGNQDPLLLRWSDTGSETDWTATVTNQAGSDRLSKGSRIVGGIQAAQGTFIWTDTDVWVMQYVGPPFVYSFLIAGTNCGLIAPNARAVIGPNVYWMSPQSFWVASGFNAQNIACPVYDVIFGDLDTTHVAKCFVGTHADTNELFFFYPSLSGGTGEIDSYVKLNVQDNLWDYGKLARTAWIDNSVYGEPLAADLNLRIQQHETGYDADGSAMSGAYIETGYAEIANGGDVLFIDQLIPDFKWLGSKGGMKITVKTKNYPGDNPTVYGPFSATPTGQFISLRSRARYVALRFEWAAIKGFSARIGTPSFRAAPAGKRP